MSVEHYKIQMIELIPRGFRNVGTIEFEAEILQSNYTQVKGKEQQYRDIVMRCADYNLISNIPPEYAEYNCHKGKDSCIVRITARSRIIFSLPRIVN